MSTIRDSNVEGSRLLRKKFSEVGCQYNLMKNSQAVKKVCGPQKGYGEKRCEIQVGGQEMAVMVG